MDALIDGACMAAANGDTAIYEKDVRGFVDLAYADMPRIPLFQPYVNVAMQKNVSGYQYWFHRRLDYRALAKGGRMSFRRVGRQGRLRPVFDGSIEVLFRVVPTTHAALRGEAGGG